MNLIDMRTRIFFDILLIFVILFLSFIGIYYVLHNLFEVSKNSIIIIFIPASIVSILAIAHGYTVGAKRHYKFNDIKDESCKKILFTIFFSGTLSLVCLVAGMYFCLAQKIYGTGVILIMVATLLSIFSLKKMKNICDRGIKGIKGIKGGP